MEVKNYPGHATTLLHSNLYRVRFGRVTAHNNARPYVSVECPNNCNKLPKEPKSAHNHPEKVAIDRVEGLSQINERHAHVSVLLPDLLLELPRLKHQVDSAAFTSKPALRFGEHFVYYIYCSASQEVCLLALFLPQREKRFLCYCHR